jgi:hypothetical protein
MTPRGDTRDDIQVAHVQSRRILQWVGWVFFVLSVTSISFVPISVPVELSLFVLRQNQVSK